MKDFVKELPIVGSVMRSFYSKLKRKLNPFTGSENYWIDRYESGGNSGPGSYSELAEFKAEIVNAFVSERSVQSVVEYGCGDGNQLKYARYPSYLGLDISPKSIELCRERFSADNSKEFRLIIDRDGARAQLALSLDVIYHLVEEKIFENYMIMLFDSAENYVIIYSTNTDIQRSGQSPHVRHREFTVWVRNNRAEWQLQNRIPNKFPYFGDNSTGSPAEFFVFERNRN